MHTTAVTPTVAFVLMRHLIPAYNPTRRSRCTETPGGAAALRAAACAATNTATRGTERAALTSPLKHRLQSRCRPKLRAPLTAAYRSLARRPMDLRSGDVVRPGRSMALREQPDVAGGAEPRLPQRAR
eukprot:6429755-Prymnesium_polylepis.1